MKLYIRDNMQYNFICWYVPLLFKKLSLDALDDGGAQGGAGILDIQSNDRPFLLSG